MGAAFGPAAITTWLVIALFACVSLYPGWIMYKNVKRCLIGRCLFGKCFGSNKDTETNTTTKWTMKDMEKAAEADIQVPEVTFSRPEFRPE